MAEFCQEETYLEGNHRLLVEGEPAERMYVIERGKVALEKKIQIGRHSTPRNATIGYVGPGKIAGFLDHCVSRIFIPLPPCALNLPG